MKSAIKGFIVLVIFLAISAAVLIFVASTPKGLETLQGAADQITGEKGKIDLTEFGLWSKEVRGNTIDKIPANEVFYNVLDDTMQFDENYPIYTEDITLDFKAKKVKKLYIILGACYLEQTESEDQLIHVSTEEVGRFQSFIKDGALYIVGEQKLQQGLSTGNFKNRILISIPKGKSLKETTVNLGAGMVTLGEITTETSAFEVGAGYIKIASLDSTKASFKVGAGKIDIEKADVGSLKTDVDMGDFKFNGDILKAANMECAIGNINAKLNGKAEDFNYAIECSVGNISIDGTEYTSVSSKKKIDNSAQKEMELKCSMGNISIEY